MPMRKTKLVQAIDCHVSVRCSGCWSRIKRTVDATKCLITPAVVRSFRNSPFSKQNSIVRTSIRCVKVVACCVLCAHVQGDSVFRGCAGIDCNWKVSVSFETSGFCLPFWPSTYCTSAPWLVCTWVCGSRCDICLMPSCCEISLLHDLCRPLRK